MRALPLSRLSRLSRRLRLALGLGLGLVMILAASLTLVVPRLAHAASLSVNDCSCYAASGGLGDALSTAASNADASNTITFTCNTSGGGIVFPSTYTVAAGKTLTLDATGQSVTLSGDNLTQLFVVSSGATLNLTNLTLAKGAITGGQGGGAVSSSGTLTVTNCTFGSNSADFGGAIAADAGTVTISDSVFTNNTAGNGGAVALAGPVGSSGTLSIINSYFAENTATDSSGSALGGALWVDMDSSTVTIEGSDFSDNSAESTGFSGAGGAIYGFNGVSGTLSISDSTFFENVASGDIASGGALNLLGVTLTVSDSTFSENSAQGTNATLTMTGGGMYIGNGSSATITGTTFTENSISGGAVAQGGCLFNLGAVTLVNSTFTGNSATASGGAADGGCVMGVAPLTLTNVTMAGNTVSGSAGAGGSNFFAVFSITITNSIIANGSGADNCAYNSSGLLTDGGHNLDSGTSCRFTAASDLQSTDPKLDPLADNTGLTFTMALQYNSPAIDAGDDGVCTTKPVNSVDQRGISRPQGTHCDIGAYEFIPLPPSTTSLKASASALTCGQQVTLTATVTGTRLTPTGTVTFQDGATTLGTATLSGSGTATLATKSLGNGSHSLQAVYGGDSHLSGSSSTTKVTVTVTGCQGLGGLGPAPQAPQQLQAPSGKSQAPRGASASYHGTSDNAPTNAGHGSTTPGLPLLPIALFVLLLLALGGGFLGIGVWRRRQARG
jgi:hypothetical protein